MIKVSNNTREYILIIIAIIFLFLTAIVVYKSHGMGYLDLDEDSFNDLSSEYKL